MEFKYYWDDDEKLNRGLISFDSLNDLNNVKINGLNARELLNKQKLKIGYYNNSVTIFKKLSDMFGDLIIEKNGEIIKKIRIVPWKLSKRNKTPQEVYKYIVDDIFADISSFLNYIIQNMKNDLKSIDSFSYQFLEEFPKSTDFFVYILDHHCNSLEKSLFNIYNSGPIHKEIEIRNDYHGSQLVLSSLINPSPYKLYNKKLHTHETILNKMIFQTAFFMMHASKIIENRLETKNLNLKFKTEGIYRKCNLLLNEYDLWSFYSTEILDEIEIKSKLVSQNNPFYKDVYKVFKIVKDIIIYISLLAALRVEDGVEMPLTEFYTIYEVWTVSKLWKTFKNKGFQLENIKIRSMNLNNFNDSIPIKLALNLIKNNFKVIIIWGVILDPSDHSTYYGGLISGLNQDDKDTKVKPDIIVILDCLDLKKVLIGDIKFSLKEKNLPKLDSLYKVLSYMEDLKRSDLFKGYNVEGLLIYPGNTRCVKTPQINNENYINITPLNMFNQDFEILSNF